MEPVNQNLILVPCDFSPLSYQALEHGALMAKSMKQRLALLNVVSKESEVKAAEKKLSFVAGDCVDNYGIRPEVLIRVGRPHVVIKEVALELNPTLVVLKTGTIRGLSRYTGIRTIKILSGTLIPFLVIQAPPQDTELHNILFPINFLNEHNNKLKRVVFFHRFYPNATMHIMTPSGKGTQKAKVMADNLKLMEKVLKDQNINVNFITHDKTKNKADDILRVSKEVNADMILIQMEKASSLSKYLYGFREQILITNPEKTSILCVHRFSNFDELD